MKTVTLRTDYPCCKREARFERIDGVPAQRYRRSCPDCNRRFGLRVTWDVMVETLSDDKGVRIERIEWTPAVQGVGGN